MFSYRGAFNYMSLLYGILYVICQFETYFPRVEDKKGPCSMFNLETIYTAFVNTHRIFWYQQMSAVSRIFLTTCDISPCDVPWRCFLPMKNQL